MTQPPHYWHDAVTHLKKDDVMAGLIADYPDGTLQSRGKPFYTLARSIIGQQVSVQSADAVWAKQDALIAFHNASLSPEFFLKISDDELRSCGYSRQKLGYIRNLSHFFIDEKITADFWDHDDNETVINHITQIKGIGRWSAEMFLIFCLMRPDIYPLDDIGVQRALQRSYGVSDDKPFDRAHAELIGKQWEPYRTVATWFLWRSLDPVTILY